MRIAIASLLAAVLTGAFADAAQKFKDPAHVLPLLAHTPGLVRATPVPGDTIDLPYFRLQTPNGPFEGYVNPDIGITQGTLANGQKVVAAPLLSGGSMGAPYALLYTQVHGAWKYVGYLPSPGGHIGVDVKNGQLVVKTPEYGPSDPNCCPSHILVEYDTLNGITLKKLRTERVKP